MNLIVLSLTCIICNCNTAHKYLRIGLAALCGAIACAMLLLFAPWYGLAVSAMAALVVPAMLFVAFGWNGKKDFFARLFLSWFSIVLLNGIAEALKNLTGMKSLTFFGALFALFVAYVLVEMAKSSIKRQEHLYAVTVCRGEQTAKCLALYDSGNLLLTGNGEPVHIASPGIFQQLDIREEGTLELVPYHSLGADGWIRVARVDGLQIKSGGRTCVLSNVWLGKAKEELLRGRSYQMILNSSVKRCLE